MEGGEKSLPEARREITWNVSTLSHLDPRTNQCKLEVQRIIHLQGIANQLPDVFTDNKKIVKSHIPAANTPARIEGPVGQSVNIAANESKPHLKRGRPIGVKDKIPRKRKKGIAENCSESFGVWEDIWGDHMHLGFYDPDSTVDVSGHRATQIHMIDEALRFAGVSEDPTKRPKSVVDVGCGIGGSSRYIASKFGAKCQGITLSPVQAERANDLAAAQGLSDKASFQVADALEQPFPDGQFDLVWSMESEHMPDKAKPWEKELLNKMCDSFYLPAWCSAAEYVKLLQSVSPQDIKAEDRSQYVAPFWPTVIRSALTWKGLTSLLRSGKLDNSCGS
ncbi:hypothetical protein SO802_023842 [Lithocarpus litseifolius]|uniref:Methyltransferase domain-containing protein n=1 Tax=Lithocarpus litseifolius TaxID=425828 RepID=A0AAW2CAH2_9ROSI